jgi:hypothetical protein
MRVYYHGKSYKLKNSVIIRLQGIALVAIGILCHIAESDGAAVSMWLIGLVMLFGKIDSEY